MQYDTSKLTPTVAEREEALRLYRAKEAAQEAYDEARERPTEEVANEELGRLVRARDAASEAWCDHPVCFSLDDDEDILFCALSGLPITDDDKVLKDEDTDEYVLRELVLPASAEGDTAGGQTQDAA
jgi:hypothetical protein